MSGLVENHYEITFIFAYKNQLIYLYYWFVANLPLKKCSDLQLQEMKWFETKRNDEI